MRTILSTRIVYVLALIGIAWTAGAHTLFLKPGSFFIPPGEEADVPLVNGTFHENENKVTVRRMTGGMIINPDGKIVTIDDTAWSIDEEDFTFLTTSFDSPGNYVVGVGTKPMQVRLSADEFNFYLRYEGLTDDMQQRNSSGEKDIAAAEKYSKYSKAILQVGDVQTGNFSKLIGHPIEIVPLRNPYEMSVGDSLSVKILKDGDPLAEELVYASNDSHREMSPEGFLDELVAVRTDSRGLAQIPIETAGRWYIRTIQLTRTGDSERWYSDILVKLGVEEPRIAYESVWATLTFEVR